ncbi:MAG TPA: hypothetical protein VHO90_12035 [Bacteroidales bacterium]|nr:hypothetical protein [Bacteroidales bacterium]
MSPYHRTYFNWFTFVLCSGVLTFITIGYVNNWGPNRMDIGGYIIMLIIFGIVFLATYNLRIIIDDKKISIKIGIGFQQKTIYFANIKEINLIENICKYSPSKSGLKDFRSYQFPNLSKKGIEIKLKDNRNGIILGVPHVPELLEELTKRLALEQALKHSLH